MSENKENEKKGFFSRLFGGSTASKDTEVAAENPEESIELPTKSALNKMKKADIVALAKDNGLELDIGLTKPNLLKAWDEHFADTTDEIISNEEAPVEEEAAPPVEEEEPSEQEKQISLNEKSPSQIISSFESQQMKTDIPDFRPGDTLVVSVKVKEGERTRLQAFEGVVMGVKKAGLNSSFIVRKISSGIGVERTFQTHSPMIDSIKVKRKGDVRQAKLFYLRERSGKSARIKERLD